MNRRSIVIDLDPVEAHLMIAPLTDYVAQDLAEAARTKGEASEYAELRAQVRKRVLEQIVDGFIPETTRLDRIGGDEFAAEREMGML